MRELSDLRKRMTDCALCYKPRCTAACSRGIDPAALLRSVWFANEAAAALDMPEVNPCIGCDAPCQASCINSVKIADILCRLHKMRGADVAIDYSVLETKICSVRLENPFLLSSSVVGSTYDMCARAFDAGWAGVSFKTISLMDIEEVSPRFSAVKNEIGRIDLFKNIEQLSDQSLPENLAILHRLKENYPSKVIIASIMGRDEKEWEYLSSEVGKAGADVIELNFSCPNMTEKGTGSDVGQVPELVERYTAAARRGTDKPILAKLTPNVMQATPAAEAAKAGGADGFSLINTIKSIILDGGEHVSVGGLSGKGVKPIALRFISELTGNRDFQGMHISGMGGIENWADAIDYLCFGAESLQVTTAIMQYGYRIIDDLKKGLAHYLSESGMKLKDIVGKAIKKVARVEEMSRDFVIYPKFDTNKCNGCGRCCISCMDGGHQAITMTDKDKPRLDAKKCVGCHLCVLVCPQNAIKSSGIKVKKCR